MLGIRVLNKSEVNFKIMPFKGTAAKSASGASMSKYDVEVEAKLKSLTAEVVKLQAAVAALQADSHPKAGAAAPAPSGANVDAIVAALQAQWPNKFAGLSSPN